MGGWGEIFGLRKGKQDLRRFLLLLLMVSLMGLIGTAFCLQFRRASGLVYNGRSLNYWLETYNPASSPGRGSAQWKEADHAIRQVGTNGIPTMLAMLRAQDTELKLRLIRWSQKQKLVPIHFVPAKVRNIEASRAFIALGDSGKSAVPSLIKIYRESTSKDSRNAVVESLGWIGPAASQAVPLILEAAGNTNNQLRASAVWTLGEIHTSPGLCVPKLVRALHDADGWVQLSAAHALGNFGREARSAVPALEALALAGGASPKLGVAMQLSLEARRAVGKIDPNSSSGAREAWPEPGFTGFETPVRPR